MFSCIMIFVSQVIKWIESNLFCFVLFCFVVFVFVFVSLFCFVYVLFVFLLSLVKIVGLYILLRESGVMPVPFFSDPSSAILSKITYRLQCQCKIHVSN